MIEESGPERVHGAVLPWRRVSLWIRSHSAVLEFCAAVPLAAVLFVFYHHLAATATFSSDNAFLPLQAFDVLHGDPTAHGWIGPQDTFFLTELPVYVVAVALHGLSPTVENVVSAGFYTLTTLTIMAIARAGLPRRDQPLAMLVALGLVAAPAVPEGASVIIPGPGHLGTALFILGSILCLHYSHRRARVALSLVAFVLLTAAVASDPLALYTGALPLALVHGVRLAVRLPRGGLDDGTAFGVGVLGALVGVVGGKALYATIGYHILPVASAFVPLSAIPGTVNVDVNNWLSLFGAQFLGQPLNLHTGLQLFRFVGYAFTIVTCAVVAVQTIRALRRRDLGGAADPLVLSQTLLAVVVCDLAATILSTISYVGSHNGRYLVPGVVAGAALAGRAAPTVLNRLRWRALGAAIAICYIAFLPLSMRYPAAPLPEAGLATWLEAHNLHQGLAGYAGSSSLTVTSGDKVRIRAVIDVNGKLQPLWWVSKYSWYQKGAYANFIVIDPNPSTLASEASAIETFGTPQSEAHVDGETVLIYDHNLIPDLGSGYYFGS